LNRTRKFLKNIFAVLCLASFATAQTRAPEPPNRSKNRIVLVDVLVRNKTTAIKGLTKEDFILTDKGKEQTIEVFAATSSRFSDAVTPPSPGVGMNRVNWRGAPVQSASVILFDRINTPTQDQASVRKQLLGVLSSLKETDSVAFCSLGQKLTLVLDFTSNPTILARAAARLIEPNSSAPTDPEEQATLKALQEALTPAQETQAVFRAGATQNAFRSIARHLAGLPGRKNLVWIARSFPTTFGSDFNRRSEYEKEVNAAIALLQEENVALYAINPSGAGAGHSETFASDKPIEGQLMPNSNTAQAGAGAISDVATQSEISDATGGITYRNANEITSAIQNALSEQELVYTIGFYPDEKTLDSKPHDINVRLSRKSETAGASIRFRKKYLATKSDVRMLTPPIFELATDPLVATAVTLAAVAHPDPARPGFQKVDVSVNVNDLKMERGVAWTGAFELGLYIDGAGPGAGSSQTINLNFSNDQLSQAASSGLIVGSAIDTKKQAVKLRAVVRDRTSGAAGAVVIPVTTP
jgi:VWFA-related protein